MAVTIASRSVPPDLSPLDGPPHASERGAAPRRVDIVGIGADGWSSLAEASRALVGEASVVLGSARQLALLPVVEGQRRRPWGRPFGDSLLRTLAAHADDEVVVLASGDPTVSGIASTLRALVPRERLVVHPAVSSLALARARMHWSAEECEALTLVGRDTDRLRRHLAPGVRLLLLTSDAGTPATVAALLVEEGYAASALTVLGDLGAAHESRLEAAAGGWADVAAADVPALHVLALEVRPTGGDVTPTGSWTTGLPDDAFEHDGQLTKRDLRASALSRLAPRPHEVLWDVGAGAGSIGIEWLRAHPSLQAWAFEADPGRAERVRRNARRLGVPHLQVREGRAPAVLERQPSPHAVFVGGGATAPGLLEHCRAALRPGGRLVVHGVTLETEQLLAAAYAEHGGELTRHGVETAAPIGTFTGWTPARAVTQWAWTAPPDHPTRWPGDPDWSTP